METDQKKTKRIFGFDREKIWQWFLYWAVVGVGFVILVFLITGTWIGVSVKERCLMAQGRFEGDCVEALAQVVDSQESSLRERNTSIWALGQLGDVRARPILEKYYTDDIPDREPYDQTLSQYELKKALKLVGGGLNLTHLLWSPAKL